MRIKGIGINAHPARIDGDVRRLEADLKFFQEVGYDIPPESTGMSAA